MLSIKARKRCGSRPLLRAEITVSDELCQLWHTSLVPTSLLCSAQLPLAGFPYVLRHKLHVSPCAALPQFGDFCWSAVQIIASELTTTALPGLILPLITHVWLQLLVGLLARNKSCKLPKVTKCGKAFCLRCHILQMIQDWLADALLQTWWKDHLGFNVVTTVAIAATKDYSLQKDVTM